MHPLCREPLWRAEDLGRPIPPGAGPRAVSVCLPTWADVIGYEEGEARVCEAMQAGYPRFRLPDSVVELGRRHLPDCALALPWPVGARNRVNQYLLDRTGYCLEARQHPAADVVVLGVDDPEPVNHLRQVWRYLGEGLSERRARALLDGTPAPDPTEVTRTREILRARLAAQFGTDPRNLFLLPSGMAAIGAVHRALVSLRGEWPSYQLGFPYVDALRLQREAGSGATFATAREFDETLAWINAGARFDGGNRDCLALFSEVPTNPLIELLDLERLSTACRRAALPLCLDDSVASVGLVNVLPHADFVTGSLTKWWSGAGDVLGGLVAINPVGRWAEPARNLLAQAEVEVSFGPEDLLVLEANSRGYAERIARAAQTTSEVGAWLETRPEFASVWWSGSAANRERWAQLRRPGAEGDIPVLSIQLADPNQAPAFHDALEICKGPSFGTDWSLACAYTLLAHYDELDWAEAQGVPRELIRLSIGLEEPTDLIDRIGRALS